MGKHFYAVHIAIPVVCFQTVTLSSDDGDEVWYVRIGVGNALQNGQYSLSQMKAILSNFLSTAAASSRR